MDNFSWEDMHADEEKRRFEELRKEEVRKEYRPTADENPYLIQAAEFARFAGVVGLVAALWMVIYFVGPDASKYIAGIWN